MRGGEYKKEVEGVLEWLLLYNICYITLPAPANPIGKKVFFIYYTIFLNKSQEMDRFAAKNCICERVLARSCFYELREHWDLVLRAE